MNIEAAFQPLNIDNIIHPTPAATPFKTSTQQIHIHFLYLALEIRLKIYAELLTASLPLTILLHDSLPLPHFTLKTNPLHPTLLLTNKQIHHEATPILYSHNKFSFPRLQPHLIPQLTNAFFTQIGDQNACLIRDLGIYFPLFVNHQLDARRDWPTGECVDVLRKVEEKCGGLGRLRLGLFDNLWLGVERILEVVGGEEGGRRFICRERVDGVLEGLGGMVGLREVVVEIYLSGEWPEWVVEKNLVRRLRGCGLVVRVVREEMAFDDEMETGCSWARADGKLWD